MIGWSVAAVLAVIAILAFSMARSGHQRQVRELRQAQRATRTEEAAEHKRQLQRIQREGADRLRRAHHPLAKDLLPAVDGLDQALEQLQEAGLTDYEVGLRGAVQGIEDALKNHGVRALQPEKGDPFNPHFHQAIARRESAHDPPQTLAAVHRRGFADDDHVLRPALVEVFVAPQESSEDPDSLSVGSEARSSSEDAPPGIDSEP